MEPVSIVVITLNEEKRISRLMEELSVQTHQEFEVIVVDSNSEDNTREVAQAYENALPKLTVHHMENRGVSLGRNTGASLAQYNRILFLDADVSLPRNFLAKALYELDEKKLEVAGVYMSSKGLPLVHKFGYGLFNAGLFATQFFFPTAIGACIFSTKRAHDEIGGFDEQYHGFGIGDIDFATRCNAAHRLQSPKRPVRRPAPAPVNAGHGCR